MQEESFEHSESKGAPSEANIIKCSNCNHVNPANTKFCSNCGSNLSN
ncbi:zinc-ribbon domain-containing protein [Candidatus Bathyarchaeota archaeon]|nr:MAG: zinc-ribbon domain-containing protein [Candidatus Bathyarchaeota archaeon]